MTLSFWCRTSHSFSNRLHQVFSQQASTNMANSERSWSDSLLSLVKRFDCYHVSATGNVHRRPFYIEGYQLGLIRQDVLEHLHEFPHVFVISPDRVVLNPLLQTYDERTWAVQEVLLNLKRKNCLKALRGWRNEYYNVRINFNDIPFMKMDRSATCLFGIKQYGIEINGYIKDPEQGMSIWIQRRAYSKQTWPGKLDNMVSGGISVGLSVMETMQKEAQEEASIPDYLLEQIRPVGTVTFYFEDERGLLPETEFVFDLELPPDFIPTNADGEVESFQLLNVEQLKDRLVSSEFKTTSCPVTLDFLIRHGIINPANEPNYWYIVEMLHMPLHHIYNRQKEVPVSLTNGSD